MVKISMYTLSTCPFCRKTKKYFRDRGIPFDYVDYDTANEKEQERIAADMMKQTDHIAFPFVRIGDTVVIGFNPDRYELLLKAEKSQAAAT
ncbi:glutaredoxin family protein [Methanocella sp. MCL-LM]|uniref:glutaredoxin family protein n=1 Tax=Methanocella sp. MCL-LM TaxID=3412035 RepID=UPI003C759432